MCSSDPGSRAGAAQGTQAEEVTGEEKAALEQAVEGNWRPAASPPPSLVLKSTCVPGRSVGFPGVEGGAGRWLGAGRPQRTGRPLAWPISSLG